jgi:hypothetical protein
VRENGRHYLIRENSAVCQALFICFYLLARVHETKDCRKQNPAVLHEQRNATAAAKS